MMANNVFKLNGFSGLHSPSCLDMYDRHTLPVCTAISDPYSCWSLSVPKFVREMLARLF